MGSRCKKFLLFLIQLFLFFQLSAKHFIRLISLGKDLFQGMRSAVNTSGQGTDLIFSSEKQAGIFPVHTGHGFSRPADPQHRPGNIPGIDSSHGKSQEKDNRCKIRQDPFQIRKKNIHFVLSGRDQGEIIGSAVRKRQTKDTVFNFFSVHGYSTFIVRTIAVLADNCSFLCRTITFRYLTEIIFVNPGDLWSFIGVSIINIQLYLIFFTQFIKEISRFLPADPGQVLFHLFHTGMDTLIVAYGIDLGHKSIYAHQYQKVGKDQDSPGNKKYLQ